MAQKGSAKYQQEVDYRATGVLQLLWLPFFSFSKSIRLRQTGTAMSNDPYQPPAADLALEASRDGSMSTDAPPVVVEHLIRTRPWVKFCSLAGFIASGFLILIGLLTLRRVIEQLPPYYLLLLGGFYLILAILFIIPSIWLSRYEKSITRLEISRNITDLEQAIAYQRIYWRQMAIMILIILFIYLLTIAISAIALLSTH